MIAARTLRLQLLTWLLVPLVILWVVDAVLTQRSVGDAMNAVYDQALYSSALAISERVMLADGQAVVDLPPVALEMLDTPQQERIFYRIAYRRGLGTEESFISGYPDLPIPPTEGPLGKPTFYEQLYRGEPVRIAALFTRIPADQPMIAMVQVAHTLGGRKALTRTIVAGALTSQVIVILLAASLVWFAVGRGLKPLSELSREVEHRTEADLKPLQLRRVPDEVSPLVDAINDLMARVRETIAAQRRFIADASHQLRTPLAVLRTQAELALRQHDLAGMREAVAQLRDHSHATSHLASQLLSLARAEPAADGMSNVPLVDLSALAREACSALVPEALSRRVDLGFEGNGPAMIRGRGYQVREMIGNLVENALNYGAPGGSITVAVAKPAPGTLCLAVEDDGPGIPEQERARVFERFYRIPGSSGDGAGLGLSIVREIARGHGAGVQLLDGAGGQGLRVEVVFPEAIPT